MQDDRSRLREALAAALAAAQDARAPDRVVALLRGAYRTLESAHFVDVDMIRWAEASLGAWRRWSAGRATDGDHRLLVVDAAGAVGDAVHAAATGAGLGVVRVAATRNATLEALATQPPTAILFDLDGELAPTSELLQWLAAEFPNIRRIGCTRRAEHVQRLRDRALFDAILTQELTAATLEHALRQAAESRSSLG